MRSTIPLAVATILAAAPLAAQGDHSAADHHGMASAEGMPHGWLMRLDAAAATPEMAAFSTMTPGWHVTTGGRGAGIFWQPSMTATGQYRLDSTIHLMKAAAHAEAFGVFVGGRALEAETQSYVYFLVRQNGEFLIKRRRGSNTENVVGWTAHEAIPSAATDGSTRYELAVDVGAEDVAFIVNGVTVHTFPRADLSTDGVAGLRINHRLDAHVESLEVTRR